MDRTFNFKSVRRSIFSTAGLAALLAFTYWQFSNYVIPELAELYATKETLTLAEAARFMWAPVVGYLLASGNILLTVHIFKPLKAFNDDGLIDGFVLGFFVGPILISILDFLGILDTVTSGIITGLLVGLILGFTMEFKK